MKISIFGTGYVGLVTGACFAEMGNEVLCADIDPAKVQKLQEGISPIYEPGLDELIQKNSREGRLNFTTDLKKAVEQSNLIFIAVGTPPGEDGSADLSYVLSVAATVGRFANAEKIVINKSTVPVGTADQVREVIGKEFRSRGVSFEFCVVSNPEFLKEGTAIDDCLKPARVVLGVDSSPQAKELLQRLYEPFVRNGNPILFMDTRSSELTKYAANAMLATKISFMNELSRLCEKVGADIEMVRGGIGSDPRIGYSFIYPGVGYGGSCFPKDVKALVKTGQQFGEKLEILEAVEAVNQAQRKRFNASVVRHLRGLPSGKKTVAVWGLAFKPGTDDVREAPAIDLIESLLSDGFEVVAHDPVAIETAKIALGPQSSKVRFTEHAYQCLEGSDVLCIMTEWTHFREPDFKKMKTLMKQSTIFDGRNLYKPEFMAQEGFIYRSIGRKFESGLG